MQRRWFAIILGVSVALNLFFLGLFAARGLREREAHVERAGHGPVAGGPRRFRQRPRPFEWMTEAERDQLRPRRKALRGTRQVAEDALRAEPFDAARLRTALGDLRRETDEIQASVHEFMLQRAGSMSPEERQRLADAQWGAERAGEPRGGPREVGPSEARPREGGPHRGGPGPHDDGPH
jgi:uncharacterized membrane protein